MNGVEEGVDTHWRLRKHLTNIKPEYLLTVAVADCLASRSLEGVDGDIELESSTWNVSYHCLTASLGLAQWIGIRRLWRKHDKASAAREKMPADPQRVNALEVIENDLKAAPTVQVTRPGKVDIFVKLHTGDHYVIELKGFDPSDRQIRLDLERLRDFLLLNNGNNSLTAGFLLYPVLTKSDTRLKGAADDILEPAGLAVSILSRSVTVEPEDGMDGSGYTVLCLKVSRKAAQSPPV